MSDNEALLEAIGLKNTLNAAKALQSRLRDAKNPPWDTHKAHVAKLIRDLRTHLNATEHRLSPAQLTQLDYCS